MSVPWLGWLERAGVPAVSQLRPDAFVSRARLERNRPDAGREAASPGRQAAELPPTDHPARADGHTFFPFRRIFVVAQVR